MLSVKLRKGTPFMVIVLFWLLLVVFNILVGGWCTDYIITFWSNFIQHPVAIPLIVCMLIGLIAGEIVVPLAIITWIISFFV